MSLVSFGQPDNGIVQISYVVEDIHKAMDHWSKNLRVGPWFLLDHFGALEATYRGKPTGVDICLAMSFAGHMNIELIQQLNDSPSVYRETIDKRGYGFHHWGVATHEYDREIERYRSQGYDLAYQIRVPSGGRVGYMDTTADLPGMIELIELGPGFEPVFNRFYRASIGWDGTVPVRPFL